MYCAKCGKELKDGTVFCAYCGNKVLDNTRDPSTISQRENTHHTSIISPRVIGILAVVLMILLVVVFIKSILFGSLKYKKGEIITLGKYEQDGDVGNGEEPIEWIVLDSGRNGTLVISRYILDNKGYNHPNEEITWADCTLRKWLNDDFYNSAFSASEKRQIKKTKLTNPNYKNNDTPGGPSTN